MSEQGRGHGPTIRVHMGTPAARPSGELHVDPDGLLSDEALFRRAVIRRCQDEHLSAGLGGTCLKLECPYEWDECPEVATDWLLARRTEERLMRELADDPTLGRDPHLITSLIDSERFWMRIAQGIPALRSVALAHMRGFELVVHRREVFHLVLDTDTPVAYDSLLRMLQVTGLEVPPALRGVIRERLEAAGMALDAWEDYLAPKDAGEDGRAPETQE